MSQNPDPVNPQDKAEAEASAPAQGNPQPTPAQPTPPAAPQPKPAAPTPQPAATVAPAIAPKPAVAAPPPKPAPAAATADKPVRTASVGQPPVAQPLKAQAVPARAAATAPAPAPAKAPAKAVAVAKPGAVARPVKPPPPAQPVRRPVHSARARPRHWLLLLSFLIIVVAPSILAAWYLWNRATDQYVSTVGFSVRREDSQPAAGDFLGGLVALGSGSSGASDSDILYQYIRSHDMVDTVDQQLDLRQMFSRAWPRDFVFSYNPDGTIEDLTAFWQRQVQVYYDTSSGLITLNVSAFEPQDAQKIAQAILAASTDKINQLSSIAREDATKLATQELEKTRINLTKARQDMTAYRMRTQIVDPQADLAGQMGVLNGLQAQLAEQLVQHDLLLDNAKPSDHRVTQSQQKIDALRRLIDTERNKFSQAGKGPNGESYAQLMAEYEKLAVDREFAEGAYRSARIAYEAAMADAQRQSRYLATHISPRAAEASTVPNRLRLLALCAGLLLIGWSIFTLVYYSVRDRK